MRLLVTFSCPTMKYMGERFVEPRDINRATTICRSWILEIESYDMEQTMHTYDAAAK
jgi:hypothetical protein